MGGIHPPPKEVLSIFESNERKATVERVEHNYTPYRVVFQTRAGRDSEWRTWAPDYKNDYGEAIDRARKHVYR